MPNITQGENSSGEVINLLLADDGSLLMAFDASGQPVQLDDTDKLAVSLYGKSVAAGDKEILVSSSGVVKVMLTSSDAGTVPNVQNAQADGLSNSFDSIMFTNMGVLFNGSTWDRQRGNHSQSILASAARTTQTDSADKTNYNGSALILIVDISLDPAAAAITPTLQIKDPTSGNYFTIWTAAAPLAAVGTYAYLFQPGGVAGSYTEAVNLRVGRDYRVRMLVADGDSITYSVACFCML